MWNDFKNSLRSGNVLTRLLIINVSVFVVINLADVFLKLFGSDFHLAYQFNHLMAMYSGWESFLAHFWGIITYQFVHENLLHLIINMLWLYWMGNIFAEFLGWRKLLSVYLLGGIAGALVFAMAYNLFPLFSGISRESLVIGASASVLAITIAAATLAPDYTIGLLFFGQVRLKYVAAAAVIIDLLSMAGDNAGGHIAHLGGALFGFIYVKQLRQGRNIGSFIDSLTEWIENRLIPGRKSLRVVHSNKRTKSVPDQETIDRILDKISKSGYSSLSAAEKEILFKASKK